MYELPIVIVQFVNEIDPRSIVHFRGAVIAALEDKCLLFHNHDNDKLRYAYPLIQYKRIHKKAAVMGIGKGTEDISQLLNSRDFNYLIGKEQIEMQIEAVNAYDHKITLTENAESQFRLRNWLPLNSKNYTQYQNSENMIERILILEDVLKGNILSFLKDNGIILDRHTEQIELHITDITAQRYITYKKVKLMAFDIEFKVNLSLPQYIGLGKNASVGCGVLTKITN